MAIGNNAALNTGAQISVQVSAFNSLVHEAFTVLFSKQIYGRDCSFHFTDEVNEGSEKLSHLLKATCLGLKYNFPEDSDFNMIFLRILISLTNTFPRTDEDLT